jgi:hypothetical protein
MVYNFTSTAVDPPAQIYVGKDKFESRWTLNNLFPLSKPYLLTIPSGR